MDPLVVLVEVMQSDHTVDEQMPCFVKSITLLVLMRWGSCKVGFMTSFPFWTKTFSSVTVVCSNCPLLS